MTDRQQNKADAPRWFDVLGLNPRKLGLALLVVTVLTAGVWQGARYYRQKKLAHLEHQAVQFLAQGDYKSAILSARQVFKINDASIPATRVMAETAEKLRSPAALLWRKRLSELAPDDVENDLAWANASLRMGELVSADRALSRVPEKSRNTLRYHEIAAALAIAVKKYPAAEYHFVLATRLDPTNQAARLNLASIRLLSSKPEIVKESRATLRSLAKDPELGATALRSLFSDARSHTNRAEMLSLAMELHSRPDAGLGDQLMFLDTLLLLKDTRFRGELNQLQKRIATRPGEISELANWMNKHDLAPDVLIWINSFPPGMQQTLPLPIIVADAHVYLKHWPFLAEWLNKQDWKELNFLRLAYAARAGRELQDWTGSRNLWRQAVSASRGEYQSLHMLGGLTASWGMTSEAEEVWWLIARGNTGQLPALESLFRLYSGTKDTRRMLRVFVRIYELNTADLVAKNNVASLSLLLNQDLDYAEKLAEENYRAQPQNTAFAATYAFSLHKQGRTKEGLDVLNKIPAGQLRIPALATYYGILLSAAGQPQKAVPYLDIAEKSGQLLPPEAALVAAARQQVP